MTEEFFDNSRLPVSEKTHEMLGQEIKKGSFSVYSKIEDAKGQEPAGIKIIIEADEDINFLTQEAAKRKRDNDLVADYLGENVAKYYGSAVVEAPKRELVKKSERWSSQFLSKIPEHTPAIMERWEHVEGRDVYDLVSYEGLSKDPDYKQKAINLSTKAAELLLREGIMLDLGQTGPLWMPNNIESVSFTPDSLLQYIDYRKENEKNGKETPQFAPTNILLSEDNELKVIDTYPIWDVSDILNDEVIEAVSRDDKEKIEAFIRQDKQNVDSRVRAVKYLYLLKSMGANFS